MFAAGPRVVKLQIGERLFTASTETLTKGSDYFQEKFSRGCTDEVPGATYFIDRNGDLFEHVMEFLRSGRPPLFWDDIKGFDKPRYKALLAEARYFGVHRLVDWLSGGE